MGSDDHSSDTIRVWIWLLMSVVIALMLGGLGYGLTVFWAPALEEPFPPPQAPVAPQSPTPLPVSTPEPVNPPERSSEAVAPESSPQPAEEQEENDVNAQAAKAIVDRACELFLEKQGNTALLQEEFRNNPQLRVDEQELYIFMHRFDEEKHEVVCIGQGVRPELVGKNMWGLRTPTGRHLFPDFISMAKTQDAFWLEYEWLNPYTQTIQIKRSYLRIVHLPDGAPAWIGCGYWKE